MAKGIEIREAHFPGRAPIDAYGNGGFRFAEMSHRGSILCLPSGIHGWEPKNRRFFPVPISVRYWRRRPTSRFCWWVRAWTCAVFQKMCARCCANTTFPPTL
ncbi:hypothetical protein BAZG_01166 [Brucella sp. NVSL 07-0026]|nr:hypothetical protein BAZG_01166 [Brucella sp. NVSL 07-0026]